MSPWLSLFELPPHPASGVFLVVCALVWGTRSRRKTRPYLLAAQAAILALVLAQIGISLSQGDASLFNTVSAVLQVNVGHLVLLWASAWVIIRGVAAIRGRNNNANIFTRNRK
tara:strand:- start:410 stop:748 length:339 start_codon:yes stop_codon:yes gene_type:complete